MSAYLMVRVAVHDPETYKKYTALSPAIIEKFGGKFLVRGGASETVEGPEMTERAVLVEFPDAEAARNFYFSDEYQAAKAVREPAADGQFVIVEGV